MTAPDAPQPEQQALLRAAAQVLEPLARLCVVRGVPIQAVEELLRRAYVQSAREACAGSAASQPDRLTSRVSTMTGLTRREVRRIDALAGPDLPAARSLASDVLTRWIVDPEFRDETGPLTSLRRQGLAPSFQALAERVTRDVHPRSLLAEMERLQMVSVDAEADTVTLMRDAFVPRNDWAQMMGFLGANVGDHLRAATANVLGSGNEHFEQSLLADELSAESVAQARPLIAEQWRTLMTRLGPQLQALMDADQAAGRPRDQAVRIGLYSWTQTMDAPAAAAPTPTASEPKP
ncbi:MAG: hypothetical protein KGL68_12080 [Burkholderiales bacterium]|nr:hypothetical protein [Burkholderiales bacterium]